MSIKRTIISTIVALAMVATVAPSVAQGVTIEELLAQIAALQAQLLALQGGTTTTGTSTYTACAGVTFTRALTVGSTGSDVKCLQQILNGTGYTVATTGAGSPGSETTYFGNLTLAAVKNWQAAQGWTPANQVGPLSRAKLNSILAGSSTGTGGTGTVIPTGAGLSVALASNNPASGTVVAGQAQAPLARLVFTNGDNAEVKVTTLRLMRGGVSSDSALSNVYLFDGAVRLTDAASVSAGVIGFNDSMGLFTIPAYSSKTITVAADILSTLTGGTVSVSLNSSSDITANSSSIKGMYPLYGNTMSIVANNNNLATAYFSVNNGTSGLDGSYNPDVTPAGTSSTSGIDPQNDYPVWYTNLNVNISNGTVRMSRFALREVGSINYSDLQNFRLYVDGIQVGSAVQSLDANGYVTFDLSSSPVSMQSGARQIKMLADITGGSSRYFSFQLKTSADITLTDGQYNVNIAPTYNNGSATTTTFTALRSCWYNTGSAYQCYINSGATTTTKTSDSPSGDVVNSASGQLLGKWTLKSNGERIKVDTLKAYVLFGNTVATGDDTESATSTTLRNAALYANGVQIGNTANLATVTSTYVGSVTPTTFNLGSSLIVDPSTPVTLELKADIYDNAGSNNDIDATDTLQAKLYVGSGNGQGMVSSTTSNVPTATTAANQLTVAAGGLTLSQYTAYTAQTIVAPQTNFKLAHFTLSASTTDTVNVSTIEADLDYVSAFVTNLYVKIGDYMTTTKATVSAANTWSVNYALPAGNIVDVTVYGDLSSSAVCPSGNPCNASVLVSGTTANSATSVTGPSNGSAATGQSIVVGTASFTGTVDGSTPLAGAVAGNQLVAGAKFKLTALYDSYTVTEAKVQAKDDNNSNNGAVIKSATLTDGINSYTVPFDSANNYFYFTGMSIPVTANSNKVLTVNLDLSNPVADTSTTGQNVKLTLYGLKALNSQGEVKADGTGITGSGITLSNAAGNHMYVYRSVPTFTKLAVTGQGTNLKAGSEIVLYRFTAGADAKGPVALKQIKFTVTVADDPAADTSPVLGTFKFFRTASGSETDISDYVHITGNGSTDLEASDTIVEGGSTYAYVIFDTEETIPAGQTYTYELRATPSGFAGSTTDADSVATSVAVDSAPADTTAGYDVTEPYLSAASAYNIYTLHSAQNGGGSDTAENVIWSDNSALSHDWTYSASSADWFGGYLIKSLPLSATGINYNN